MKRFTDYMLLKEEETTTNPSKDWKKEFISLEKGFVPPPNMQPVINAFLESDKIAVMKDTSNDLKMPKKALYLTGSSVRNFLRNKAIKKYHLVTPATPEQIAHILHAAGFKMGNNATKLKLTFTPKSASDKDKKIWFVGETDGKGNPLSIGVYVKGDVFNIATFKKNAITSDGVKGPADFSDNPIEDANGRDINMNALYIELSKADKENSKMYDPTGKGWHDVKHGAVRMIGNTEEKLEEDPTRLLRAIRIHSQMDGGDKMDDEIEKAMSRFSSNSKIKPSHVVGEFLKGIGHPDTNIQTMVDTLGRSGLSSKLFPNAEKLNTKLPEGFKKDRSLLLAWLLKNNPTDMVTNILGDKEAGWSDQDRSSVPMLLKLLDFTADQRPQFLKDIKGSGLSRGQLRNWADLFASQRPTWAKHIIVLSDNKSPLASLDDVANKGLDKCSCHRFGSLGCTQCGGTGVLPPEEQQKALDRLEIERFKEKLPK